MQGEWKKMTAGRRGFWGVWCYQVSIKEARGPVWRSDSPVSEPEGGAPAPRGKEGMGLCGQLWEKGVQEWSGPCMTCIGHENETEMCAWRLRWISGMNEIKDDKVAGDPVGKNKFEEAKFGGRRNGEFKWLHHANPELEEDWRPAHSLLSGSQTYMVSPKLGLWKP